VVEVSRSSSATGNDRQADPSPLAPRIWLDERAKMLAIVSMLGANSNRTDALRTHRAGGRR
jgi:hypothetical protein